MKHIGIKQARQELPNLVDRAEAGEERLLLHAKVDLRQSLSLHQRITRRCHRSGNFGPSLAFPADRRHS